MLNHRCGLSHGASRCPNGEGCQVPLSNSCPAAQNLGGVSEGDRTGRATRVSRESSGGEAVPQPAVQGGDPANQSGPTDAWVTLATVPLTSASQPYVDLTMIRQPPRLYRLVPVP